MTDERVEVRLDDRARSRVVGHLRDVGQGPHFEYAASFLTERIRLSPFKVPNDARVFGPTKTGLHRLQGLIYDALPDGWGLRLLHQSMRDAGIDPMGSSPVTWLRALGTRGMGALTFHPESEGLSAPSTADLAALAAEARRVDADHVDDVLPALSRAGSGSGGARPKLVAAWNDSGAIADAFAPLADGFRPVLIKFAANGEPEDAPLVEAAYLTMAARAGLDVAPHRVHPVRASAGKRTTARAANTIPRWALVVDRFDRVGDARRHVHSLAGLLELDYRRDVVDYRDLIKVALALTNDRREARRAWQRAAFNVGAHNRDDHTKNVAFLMRDDGEWGLAPAYDLTFAGGPGGYHTMMVSGESRAPGRSDLLRLADDVGLPRTDAEKDVDALRASLAAWPRIAGEVGVSRARTTAIGKVLAAQSKLLAR